MGGACRAYGGEAYTGFWWVNLGERDNLGDTGVDGKMMDLQEEGCGDMDWIELAQDRGRWPALVKAIMKLRVHKMRGIS